MAIKRQPKSLAPRTITKNRRLAYAICAAFYRNMGCACEKGSHDTVCEAAERAANQAKFILSLDLPDHQ